VTKNEMDPVGILRLCVVMQMLISGKCRSGTWQA